MLRRLKRRTLRLIIVIASLCYMLSVLIFHTNLDHAFSAHGDKLYWIKVIMQCSFKRGLLSVNGYTCMFLRREATAVTVCVKNYFFLHTRRKVFRIFGGGGGGRQGGQIPSRHMTS